MGKPAAIAALFLALFLLPLVTDQSYIRHVVLIAMMYGVVASGWNITLGFGGIFNFAHPAFFAIGAYAAGISIKTFGVNPLWTPLLGGLFAVIAALVVCLPVLRLKGIYVILVTFGFSQLCLQFVLNQRDLTGGNFGLVSIPPLRVLGYSFRSDGNLGYYYVALVLLALTVLAISSLMRAPLGWRIIALRDNETYAVSRGVRLASVRLATFAISAVFPGVIGAVYALYVRSASPDLFGFPFLTIMLSIILLGGIGTVWGPVVGALVFCAFSEAMTPLGPGRYLVTAVMIVLVLRFFPAGLAGIPAAIGLWRARSRAADTDAGTDAETGPKTGAKTNPGREPAPPLSQDIPPETR